MKRNFSARVTLGIVYVLISNTVLFSCTVFSLSSWASFPSNIFVRDRNGEEIPGSQCNNQLIAATDVNMYSIPSFYTINACVTQGKDLNLAQFQDNNYAFKWAIKSKDDDTYRVIQGIALESRLALSPATNRLVYLSYTGNYMYKTLTTIDDARIALTPSNFDIAGKILTYRIDDRFEKKWLGFSANDAVSYLSVEAGSMSTGGRYYTAWVNYKGYVVVDFQNATVKYIGRFDGTWHGGQSSNPMDSAITEDGEYVFIGGPSLTGVDVSNCGVALDSIRMNPDIIFNLDTHCVRKDYSQVYEAVGFNGYSTDFGWLSPDSLVFLYRGYPGSEQAMLGTKVVNIQLTSHTSKLDYLALGDSYTSGRGDLGMINDSSYFIKGTDGPNGCHVSSRSFPFLLQQFHNMMVGRVQSVACAGAQLNKDYYGSSSEYLGQSDQLLGGDDDTVALARSDAIKKFTPGIVKQIEFVKDTQPRIVTITAGGNDVGFGDIIAYCATPQLKVPAQNTCDIARPGTKQRGMLGDAIQSQYGSMVLLIKAIKEVSPDTIIYVVGYPSFVSDDNDNCMNAGALNRSERALVNESVRYMNQVLQAATESAGANYRNIEAALYGGRICEGSEYVTGLLDVTGTDFENQKAHMFHPNHLGHEKMALNINRQGFSTDASNPNASGENLVPKKPKYFETKGSGPSHRQDMVRGGKVIAGRAQELTVQSGTFKANSPVSISVLPTGSDVEAISSNDGGLSMMTTKLPMGGPGYRLVIAEGKDSQDSSIKVYQFIEVQSDRRDDKDGDGIRDDKDKCAYIETWYDEQSRRNVCKP